jgi:hypothetical protein
MAALTEAFLVGQILTPLSIVEQWPSVISATIPLCSTEVTAQFTAELAQLNSLLDAMPSPKLNTSLILMPIDLVNDIKVTFSNFEHAFGGPYPTMAYAMVVDSVNSVFDNYSIQFQVTSQPKNGYYIY